MRLRLPRYSQLHRFSLTPFRINSRFTSSIFVGLPPRHIESGRSIIRNCVRQLNLPVLNSTVDDFNGRQNIIRRLQAHSRALSRLVPFSSFFKTKAISPSYFWLKDFLFRDGTSIFNDHAIQQMSIIRFIHPEHVCIAFDINPIFLPTTF